MSVSKKIELLSNVAIIVVALLLGIVLTKRYLFTAAKIEPDNASVNYLIPLGTKVSLSDVNWQQTDQTLLVVLSVDCRYCKESAPFYQRLALKRAQVSGTRLIAVLPQAVDAGRKYLVDLGVPVDEVRQANLNSLGVKGTPTLILVDNKGSVTASWVGKLPAEKESEVINRL